MRYFILCVLFLTSCAQTMQKFGLKPNDPVVLALDEQAIYALECEICVHCDKNLSDTAKCPCSCHKPLVKSELNK